jgi:peptide/nickel transport system substrate-binding protein
MVLVRNPNYWNSPLPYLDQVVIKPVLDEQQRTNTLTSGAANMMWTRSPVSEQGAEKGGDLPQPLVTNGGVNIYFNLRRPPFNDARVRQAVIYGVDRNQYAKVVNNDLIPAMHSIFSEQSPFFDKNLTQLPFDAAKAQSLFDAAAADAGGKIKFTLNAFNVPTQVNQATYLQGILNGYHNVSVDVAFYGVAPALTKLASADFDAFMAGNNFIDPEPLFTSRYVCNATPSYPGWCDQKFDADVADARSTLDPSQRLADFKDAQKLLYAAAPTLYFERNYTWMMVSPSVQNFTYVNDAMVLLDRTWMKTK